MAAIKTIQAVTDEFFALHWPKNADSQPPAWVPWEPFLFRSAPNYQLPGCYALIATAEIAYVGVGIAKGWGKYKDHGISIRLSQHVVQVDWSKETSYKLKGIWKNHITGICTIGFTSY